MALDEARLATAIFNTLTADQRAGFSNPLSATQQDMIRAWCDAIAGRVVAEVQPELGDGGGGTLIHNELTGRDAPDCHPIGAITGLLDALEAKSNTGHGHTIGAVDGLQLALDARVPATRQVFSGAGLVGGGSLGSDLTLSVGAGPGLVVEGDAVAVDFGPGPAQAAAGDHSHAQLARGVGTYKYNGASGWELLAGSGVLPAFAGQSGVGACQIKLTEPVGAAVENVVVEIAAPAGGAPPELERYDADYVVTAADTIEVYLADRASGTPLNVTLFQIRIYEA